MPDKIDGMGGAGVQPSRTTGPTEARRDQREATQAPETGNTGEVQFTETARRLQRLESELASRSEVDEARVEDVRERIASGRFEPDPQRIADRLIKTEQDL